MNVALAHCNFNLRGAESDADEDFVLQLAEDLGVEVFIQHFDTTVYVEENKLSIQMAARTLRYNWFDDLCKQLHFDYILTAHHADDNLETFLINLTRGTGLDGLTGIPEVNTRIIRPLLPFSREDVEAYAKTNKIQWREDASNVSTKYLRNKLRHDIIPVLKSINPQLLQNFNKTQSFLKDSKGIIDHHIDTVFNSLSERVNNNTIRFNIDKIKALPHPKAYLYELLKDYNFSEWDDVVTLLDSQSGKQILSATHRLIKDRDFILLSEKTVLEEQNITILNLDSVVNTPLGRLCFRKVKTMLKHDIKTIYIDHSKLEFPLTLRKWQEGDWFYPFGMRGKKKLSKYFKDEKLSLLDKEQIWLLCSKNDVVWILNRRADDRFRVTDDTTNILQIELK